MDKHPAPRMGTETQTFGKRALAFILDGFIFGALSLGLLLPASLLGDAVVGLVVLVVLAGSVVYGFLLEGLYGYTPGKYLLGLVVVKSDGSNCTVGASVLRNLLWLVDSLPTANLVGTAMILLTDDNQRVGDLVADTVVVKQQ